MADVAEGCSGFDGASTSIFDFRRFFLTGASSEVGVGPAGAGTSAEGVDSEGWVEGGCLLP